MVPGGGGPHSPKVPEAMVQWIAEIAQQLRRLCAICTGAFLLAAAKQLDGCKATTHWAAAELLRKQAPKTQIEADKIYIRQGKIWIVCYALFITIATGLIAWLMAERRRQREHGVAGFART